jgi:hypothetical protein
MDEATAFKKLGPHAVDDPLRKTLARQFIFKCCLRIRLVAVLHLYRHAFYEHVDDLHGRIAIAVERFSRGFGYELKISAYRLKRIRDGSGFLGNALPQVFFGAQLPLWRRGRSQRVYGRTSKPKDGSTCAEKAEHNKRFGANADLTRFLKWGLLGHPF